MRRLTGMVILIMLLLLLLGACAKAKDALTPEQVYTQAAQTVQAQLTVMAEGNPTETAVVDSTPSPTITSTPTHTVTPTQPTSTPGTQATSPSGCTNRATYIDDITYPDGAEVSSGEVFTKTWKMMNSGTCNWTSSYKIVFISSDGITAPTETPLTTGIEVPAGAQININVPLTAPDADGTYTAYFKFQAPDGTVFGINTDGASSFYVKIKVVKLASTPTATISPTPTPTFTPTPE